MENAADALRIAFSVIVFVAALAIALGLLGQAKATANQLFYSMDKIAYLEPERISQDDPNHRLVGLETIIPTIYRYPVENCGVTIIDKNGDIVARYDVETENVASQISYYISYKNNMNNRDKPAYQDAYKKYLSHIDYLITNLKYDNKLVFNDYENIEFKDSLEGTAVYKYNKTLDEKIQELYTYTKGESTKANYGAPWGTKYVAKRIEADLTGVPYEDLNGNKYCPFEDEDGLISMLDGKQYKEYILEVDTSYLVTNHEETTSAQTEDSTKLEIIYVEVGTTEE